MAALDPLDSGSWNDLLPLTSPFWSDPLTAPQLMQMGNLWDEGLNRLSLLEKQPGDGGDHPAPINYRFNLDALSDLSLSLDDLTGVGSIQNWQGKGAEGAILNSLNWNIAQGKFLGGAAVNPGAYQDSGDTSGTISPAATVPQSTFNSDYGYGRVDAAAAVAAAVGRPGVLPAAVDLGGPAWGLDQVKAPEVWSQGYTGAGITVAVLDSGIDYTHPDLDHNLWINRDELFGNGIDDDGNGYVDDLIGWDFANRDNLPLDKLGHGTHVAGAIAAENNEIGITGVAYNAKIMPIQVLGETPNGQGADATLAAGINYAVANGADILNLSLEMTSGEDSLMPLTQAALVAARQAGLVTVMASGNQRQQGATGLVNPAAYVANDLGIAAGAVDISGQVADFSNPAGSTPLDFVVAPGVDILSTVPGNLYGNGSGTSMATAYVSGVAALVLSANPLLAPSEVESLLTATADATGFT